MNRLFITGGHLTPALATVAELQKRGEWQIYFLGRKHSLEGDATLSVEYLTLKDDRTITFLPITTGRLQRHFTRYTIPSLVKIPFGFLQSLYWLAKYRPSVVLSFGGYVAIPVVLASFLLSVPVLTHEQTLIPGLSNRIISFFASKILLSWPDPGHIFPKNKSLVVGNPLRPEIFQTNKTTNCLAFKKMTNKHHSQVLYITGGNQGMQSANKIIKDALPELLKTCLVIHSAGVKNFPQMNRFRETLSDDLKEKYFLFDFINQNDIGWVLNSADLIVGRAGANTVSEIAALGKVAVLIPLPWSGGGEQSKNAQMLLPFGSTILPQDKLTPSVLRDEILRVSSDLKNHQKLAAQAKTLVNYQAASLIVAEVEKVVQGGTK
ncbi:MAG: hypothetical protein UY21_C0010G0004 [Microgenomates group bacterium GW2011_GWA1_48_10]|nr:MAG: hypothetical protein UY21_C0010G0004 [Microgenomates group bacterium GW2011_GWA1_48_10]